MKKLTIFFLPFLFRNWGITFATALSIRFAAQAIFHKSEEIGHFTIIVMAILGLVGSVHLRQNLTWVKSLPISKLKIYLSSALLFLANLLFGVLAIYFYIAVCSYLPHTTEAAQFQFGKIDINRILKSPETYMTISIATTYLILMFHSPFGGLKQIQVVSPIKRRHQITMTFAILILIYAVINLESFFFLGSLLVATGWAGIVHGFTRDFSIYQRPKKYLSAFATVVVIAQIGFIYGYSIHNLYGNDAQLILDSEKFLGTFSPTIDDSKLVPYFENLKEPKTLESLVSQHPNVLKYVDIKKWTEKADVGMIVSLISRVPPKAISSDLRAQFLSKTGNSKIDYPSFYLHFLKPTIESNEIDHYLKNGNLHEFAFALSACRMKLREDCSAPIQNRLITFSDSNQIEHSLIMQSLYTLSIIHGKWIGLNEYAELKHNGAARKIASENLNCDVITKTNYDHLPVTDAARFNYCIRKIALNKGREGPGLENLGWISGNLYPYEKNKISRLLNN